jgi:cyclohexa-1,5-dienecarbonyl-CoA hydratase
MSFQHIRTELADGVGTIRLNRPPVNVLNIKMMEEINQALRDYKEEGVKVLLFRAEGKAFSTGVDVGEHMGDMVERMIETFHALFRLMDEIQCPSIAVVNGAALGGGCELALYCDMAARDYGWGFPSHSRSHPSQDHREEEGNGIHPVGKDHWSP